MTPLVFCLSQIKGVKKPFCAVELRDEADDITFRCEVKEALYSDSRNLFIDGESEFPEWDALSFYGYEKQSAFRFADYLAATWLESVGFGSYADAQAYILAIGKHLDGVLYIPLSEVRAALGVAA